MKKQLLTLTSILCWLFTCQAQSLSGTYPVGPGNTYTNLTDVASALKTGTLFSDVVFELQSNYTSTTELFPISFKQTTTSGGNWKVTIRPAAGTVIVTEGDPGATNALINIDSTDRLIIDGRAGGTGSIAWTIRNKCALIAPVSPGIPVASTSAGPAIQFLNDATYDTLTYLQIEGMNPVQTSSVVYFGITAGTQGNSYNGVNYCNIRDRSDTTAGTATPAAGIISIGGGTVPNNYNTISNNNIFNFFYPSSQTHGIRVNNATGWVIQNNRFFQEQPRVFTVTNNHKVIRIDNAAGNATCTNHTVMGNIIGYSSSNGTGIYDLSGLSTVLSGMDLNFSLAGNNIIRGNIINNIRISTASTNAVTASPAGVLAGININQGYVTIDSNVIGSKTDSSSMKAISSGAAFGAVGIAILNKSGIISNNYIGGFTLENPTPGSIRGSFCGISSTASGGSPTISNNEIGNANLPYSVINRTGNSNTTAGHTTVGISFSTSPTTVTGNTVANLVYQGGSTTAQVIGINSTGTVSAQKIGTTANGSGNTIFNLFNNAPATGTGTSASVIGILATNTTAGQFISQNHIYDLMSTNTSTATVVIGIHYAGTATNSGDIVSRNYIHSLASSSTNTSAAIIGLNTATSSCTYKNNLISLGADTLGSDITTGISMIGINNTPTGAGTDNYYHNTVYIGGNNVISNSNTYAFIRNTSTNTTNLINNVLVNNRSNSNGSAQNIVLKNNSALNAGLNSNYNVYYRNGNGGKLFASSAQSFDTLTNWQNFNSPAALDVNSGVGDPLLMNPFGSPTTINLHPQSSNPMEGKGSTATGVNEDYDGTLRSTTTPTDIGAFSGSYVFAPDIFAPVISYIPMGGGIQTSTRTVNNFQITDNTAVAAGSNAPRFYFKKKSEANAFAGNFPGSNGWKYVSANNASSPYNFTIDYSLLFSSLAVGDTIMYFVVAQDNGNYMVSSPGGATYNADPPIQNITAAPSVLNSFMITNNTLSGARTVCASGCDYTNLTGSTGLFHAIDTLAVDGDITATISSDLLEDGSYALNYFGPYKLTIQPDVSTRTISNAGDIPSASPMIHFFGAANVTIDGGASKNLIFKNTNSNPANTSTTIQFSNGATNDTLRNCILQNNGSTTTRGTIVIGGTNGATGIVITQNKITDTSNASSQQPANGILSNATGNTNLYITNNEIYNFRSSGISLSSFGSTCVISGNHIYNNTTTIPTTGFSGISVSSGTGYLIDSNYIGGQAPLLGGGVWSFNSNTASFGISYSSPGTSLIQRNKIGNITGIISAVIAGINASGSLNPLLIKNNEIHDITSAGTNGALFTSLGGITYSSSNANNSITGNTIYNLYINSASGSPGVSGIGTNGTGSYMAGGEISNNKIYGFQMNPAAVITPDFRGIGPLQGNSTVMNITIANNFISLGDNITNNAQIEGIWANVVAASAANIYNNSIYVGGTISPASTLATTALLKPANSLGAYRNNILYNVRTKSSGAAFHTALSNSSATPANSWNSDFNLFYASDTAAAAVTWGTSTYGFAAWKSIVYNENNTKSKTVAFTSTSTGDLHLTSPSVGDVTFTGTPLVAVTVDFDNETRSLSTPYIGADEVPSAPLPVKLNGFTAYARSQDVILNWSTASESNSNIFRVEASTNGTTFTKIGTVKAKEMSNTSSRYQFTHANAKLSLNAGKVIYYRLASVDNDGSTAYSSVVAVPLDGSTATINTVSVFPNPFTQHALISITSDKQTQLRAEILDVQGRVLSSSTIALQEGLNTVSLEGADQLKPGIYLVRTTQGDIQKTTRILKH